MVEQFDDFYQDKIFPIKDVKTIEINSFTNLTRNNPCCIIYILSGNCIIDINNKQYEVFENNVVLLNSSVIASYVSNTRLPIQMIIIEDNGLLNSIPLELFSPIITFINYKEIKETFISIRNEYEKKEAYYRDLIEYKFKCLFMFLMRKLNITDITDLENYEKSIMKQIKKYIEKNYNENLSINNLSKLFHISNSCLSHSFKQEYGIGPINYLINTRITVSKRLLTVTNKTIQEIAEDIGYENANYFSILFKKNTNCTPTQFRLKTRRKV